MQGLQSDISCVVINYWRQNLWRSILNDLPLSLETLSSFTFIPNEDLAQGQLTHPVASNLWVAPFVFKNKVLNSYWIPLWIPAIGRGTHFAVNGQCPWVPPSQFDVLKGKSPLSEQMHYFDDYLRHEFLGQEDKIVWENWRDYYSACITMLNRLSGDLLFERLDDLGFVSIDEALIITESELFSFPRHFGEVLKTTPLLQCYADPQETEFPSPLIEASHIPVGTDKQRLLADILKKSQQAVLMLTPEDSYANCMEVFKGWYLVKFGVEDKPIELIIIDQANRLLPQQVAPFLSYAKKALFWGDRHDLEPSPVMSAIQEELELIQYDLAEDQMIEQLHYKGMLAGSGNAFSVALAQLNPYWTHGENRYKKLLESLVIRVVDVLGKSKKIANGIYNEAEGKSIAAWLKTGPLLHELDDVAIVTPFEIQKEILIQCLQAEALQCPVYTFDNLPFRQWPYLIFSSVYTLGDNRPFVFDQGDQLFTTLLARTLTALWVFGDLRIFDPKMQSPSGNLAKAWRRF